MCPPFLLLKPTKHLNIKTWPTARHPLFKNTHGMEQRLPSQPVSPRRPGGSASSGGPPGGFHYEFHGAARQLISSEATGDEVSYLFPISL